MFSGSVSVLMSSGRAHHVAEPAVGNEHHGRAQDVQQHAEPEVPVLRSAVLHPVPRVVIHVQRERLDEEQCHVQPHAHVEERAHVRPEARIQRAEEEDEHRAPDRRRAVGDEQQAHELLRQLVEALVAAEHADRLCDDAEHRHAEHERREHQVDLGRNPDRAASADDREVAVLAHRRAGLLRPRGMRQPRTPGAARPRRLLPV